MNTWIDYEAKAKRATRPVAAPEMMKGLARELGYAHKTTLANVLSPDCLDKFLTVGRWWYLQSLLGDFRPAMAMMADEGFYVARMDARTPAEPERQLLITTARLIEGLAAARSPESDGGEMITTNELRDLAPLGMELQALVSLLLTPAAGIRYSLGGVDRRLLMELLARREG
ncbi:MAG: hypothetical protein OEZ32_13715 [Nitrospinota bacterium]|nr:hypothetical protein [Nitrospinota bacterium]